MDDMQLLVAYMKHIGADTSWWDSIVSGENTQPFAQMRANDTNNQVMIHAAEPAQN